MEGRKIFENLRVIDLSTVLAGPSVGSFFAELGAEVIKVEAPQRPDVTRFWKLPREDRESTVSAYFSSVNYKKNYTELNLKDEAQRIALLRQVRNADLVLMNFKKGDQEKLKITDQILRKNNPELIIGKINGFGADSNRVAYDLILQAETGFMAMNGTPKSGPVKMPLALIDVLAAHHLKEGLLIELLAKNKTKNYKGKTIYVSLYDAAVSSLVNQASNYLMNGHIPKRIGSLHPNIAPYGELFETSDGEIITFAIGNNLHFKKLCLFLKAPELVEHHKFSTVQLRVTHRTELYEQLKPLVKKYKAEEVLNNMRKESVPCGEIKDLSAVFSNSKAKELIREENIAEVKTKRVTGIAFKRK